MRLRRPKVKPIEGFSARRNEARLIIIQQANLFRYNRHFARIGKPFTVMPKGTAMPTPILWGLRNINEAVSVVRHNRLVSNEVLRLAGFNPHGGE